MKGLDLSEQYFREIGLPAIAKAFPEAVHEMAFGLVGEGSECFGFDDDISRDHDWGAGFCIWMTKQTYEAIGMQVQRVYDALAQEGYPMRIVSTHGDGRTGAMMIRPFYFKFLGVEEPPDEPADWLSIPEEGLANATNGKVFLDEHGDFTARRNRFLQYYPEDVRLKKISAKAVRAAQTGQYNYLRSYRRNDIVAGELAKAEFCRSAMALVFLLNRKYAPYYKWTHRAIKTLPRLSELNAPFRTLMQENKNVIGNVRTIGHICRTIAGELRRQGLSESTSDFLIDHALEVSKRIQDPILRQMHFAME